MKNFFKKTAAALSAAAMIVTAAGLMPLKDASVRAQSSSYYKFDFGNGGTQGGYTGVSASMGYDASRGYGFSNTSWVADKAASGSGALSDAVQFNNLDRSNTFKADVPNGLYKITVWLGNTTRASVVAEDVLQLINLTGNNAVDSFTIPITDGQLNLMVTEGKTGTAFTLSALEISKISDDVTTPPTIWLCGDSTVCNYYPKDTAVRVGWGQMFDQYVPDSYMVRNLAASGQWAAGFLNAGQFEPVRKYGKKGDYYFISIGINDTNYSNETEYYNSVTTMVKEAKERGITVILVKQQGRNGDITRDPLLTGRWFGSQLDKIGSEQNVQVIDLFNLAQNYFLSIGADKTAALYDDGLHFNREGAKVLANLVAKDVKFGEQSGQPEVTTTPQTTEPPQTSTTPPAPDEYYGDADGNQIVNMTDLTMLSQYLIGDRSLSEDVLIRLDLNSDGKCQLADMSILKQYICMEKVELVGTKIMTYPDKYFGTDAVSYDAFIESDNSGFTGSAYLNFYNETGSSAEWSVNVAKAGNYLITFRYANGSADSRPLNIFVNDSTEYAAVDFPSTSVWTTWNESSTVIKLEAGTNKVKAVSVTANGGPNVDYFTLEKTDKEPVTVVDPVGQHTVYIAGDSTVQSYNASYAPQQGWGFYLGKYLSDSVTVSNQAIAGRSSKSFFDNGRLDTILSSIKQGDYLLVQFAINDADYSKEERYAPVCNDVNNPAAGSYEYYIEKYVEGCLAKQATPVLVTTVIGLKAYSGGKFVPSYTNYCNAMKQIAAKYNIPCIDLNTMMVDNYNSIGYDAAKLYHMYGVVAGSTDMTHFSEAGAENAAKLVAQGLKGILK
ncbi:MAG: GDSL-type esterase/lipase family protein [Oscillospiraceae bacterium]|nr:GDSL-type esterase/lipase family protein [Oscillospiraceae bacterium]